MYLFVFIYVYCTCAHMFMKVPKEGKKGSWMLGLELEMAGICLTWVLRIELGSSERRVNASNSEPYPQPYNEHFLNN